MGGVDGGLCHVCHLDLKSYKPSQSFIKKIIIIIMKKFVSLTLDWFDFDPANAWAVSSIKPNIVQRKWAGFGLMMGAQIFY